MTQPVMPAQTIKKKPQQLANNASILESIRDIGSGVGQSVKKDVIGKVASDALTSLFGSIPKSVEFPLEKQSHTPQEIAPHPVMRQEMPSLAARSRDAAEVRQKLEAVRAELQALTKSMSMLSSDIQKAIQEVPPEPGIYHVTFFERLRSVISALRQQIDDSRSWLSLWTSRKKKRQYWSMYKKHGTTFGLSSERILATQAG